MNVQWSEMATEFLLLLYANVLEVLVSEDDDSSLGNEQGELVPLLLVELAELLAADFRSNDGCQFRCPDR